MSTKIDPKNTKTSVTSNSEYLDDVNLWYSKYSGDIKLYDTDALNCMIDNCLFTMVGERWNEPEFGSNIMAYVYEPCDDTTAKHIRYEIFSSLDKWMNSYITVDKSSTDVVARPDLNEFRVVIHYIIKVSGVSGTLNMRLVQ